MDSLWAQAHTLWHLSAKLQTPQTTTLKSTKSRFGRLPGLHSLLQDKSTIKEISRQQLQVAHVLVKVYTWHLLTIVLLVTHQFQTLLYWLQLTKSLELEYDTLMLLKRTWKQFVYSLYTTAGLLSNIVMVTVTVITTTGNPTLQTKSLWVSKTDLLALAAHASWLG